MNRPSRIVSTVAAGIVFLLSHFEVGAQSPTIRQPGPSSSGRHDLVVFPGGSVLLVTQEPGAVVAETCPDTSCLSSASRVVLANLTASRIRVAMGIDGMPVVSLSIQNNGLRFIKCITSTCSTNNMVVLEPGNLGNTDHALLIPPDGLPMLAYFDANAGDIRFVRCGDVACVTNNVFSIPDSADYVGRAPALALVNGLPQIAHVQGTAAVRLTQCATMDCTSATTKTLVAENAAHQAAITARDGTFLLAYMTDTAAADSLKVAKCNDSACSRVTVTTIDLTQSDARGRDLQLRTGADGMPVMAYLELTSASIKVARCTRPDCLASTVTTAHAPNPGVLVQNAAAGLAIGPSGTPTLAYAQAGKLTIQACNTRSCQ